MKDNRGHNRFNSVTNDRHYATKDKHLCDRPIISSLRASSPIWASEASLARTRERAAKPRGAKAFSRGSPK